MSRPRLLDLFCGAGGAAVGYDRVGFDVTGVDIQPQPRYPFEFVQADALEYVVERGAEYDVIHASPPCQRYSRGTVNRDVSRYPDLIGPTREALETTGGVWVIENVEGAPLREPVRLCGQQFGLRVIRHRLFESSELLLGLPHGRHTGSMLDGSIVAVYGGKWMVTGRARKGEQGYAFYGRVPLEFRTVAAQRAAMGIDWMVGQELKEAIPPAYTEFIGAQLLAAVDRMRGGVAYAG